MRTWLLVGLLGVLASCALEKRARTASNELERAITFVEQRRSGAERDLHAREDVPLETGVDVDSTILVNIDREALLAAHRGVGLGTTETPEAVGERKASVVSALDWYGEYLSAASKLNESFAALRLARVQGADIAALRASYLAARSATNAAEGRFMDGLASLWKEGTPEEGEIRVILEADSRDMTGMREFLQRQIDRLDAEFAAASAAANARTVSLRLEAVLERDGADPEGVHLEGYDELKAGRVRHFDRTGLAMSDAEIAELTELMTAANELSDAANRVLREEMKFADAFGRLDGRIAGGIGQRLVELNALVELFAAEALTTRIAAGGAAFEALKEELKEIAREAGESLRATADSLPAELQARLAAKDFQAVRDALAIVVDVRTLEADWRTVTAATLPALLGRTAGIARKVKRLATALEPLVADLAKLVASMEQDLVGRLTELGGERVAAVKATWQRSEARRFVQAIVADVERVRGALEFLADLADLSDKPRPVGTIRVPEARAVPLERVANTAMPLTRTSRRPGDFVTVRSTLLKREPDGLERELQSGIASFEVERFGWHADLEPAVTLVKPDRLSGGSDRLNFAPMIAWMHRYMPYPEQSDLFGLRFLRPAIGVHATFLDFDPDLVFEVGLGGSVSLFDGVLMGGVGYNLMAEDRGDGDVYYFVGSSLIPLLQATGLRDE